MQKTYLSNLNDVSRMALGGGGIGQVWGKTDRKESVLTIQEAIESGITLIDLAPSYGNGEAERVFGEAFDGSVPDGVYVTTKYRLGSPKPEEVLPLLLQSLEESLERMKVSKVDLMILHGMVVPDGFDDPTKGTELSLFRSSVGEAFENLIGQGLIGGWGITGIGVPSVLAEVLDDAAQNQGPKPSVIQIVTNLLDSPGSMKMYDEPANPRRLIAGAKIAGMGVMGIRAVQAGALTSQLDRPLADDHPEIIDFKRAAPFREIAARLGESPASLAHQYALAAPGVDTVVLGVKNREELRECISAETAGPLDLQTCTEIDLAVGRIS